MKRIVTIVFVCVLAITAYAGWRGAFDDAYFAQVSDDGWTPIPDLIAHWKMNDNVANTDVEDSKGSYEGVSARNTADMSISGKINLALDYNGSSDTISAATDSTLNTLFDGYHVLSVALWFKETLLAGRILFLKFPDPYLTGLFMYNGIINSNFKNNSDGNCTSVNYPEIGTNNVLSGNWNHVVWTYDGSGAASGHSLYFNNVVCTNKTVERDFLSTAIVRTDNTQIGGLSPWGQWFSGAFDDIRVYTNILSSSQVSALYNSGNGTEEE